MSTVTSGLNIVELGDKFFDTGEKAVITRLTLPGGTQVYGMGKDITGNMWIGGMDGTVYRFDPLKNSFTLLPNGRLLNNGYFTRGENIPIN